MYLEEEKDRVFEKAKFYAQIYSIHIREIKHIKASDHNCLVFFPLANQD